MAITNQMRNLVNVNHATYKAKTNQYRELIKTTGFLFDQYTQLFERIEEHTATNPQD